MRFFVDSVDTGEIRKALALGLADGVTTNPSLVAASGRGHEEAIREISGLIDGPVCVETLSLDTNGILREAEIYRTWGKNVSIKIPICREGLAAARELSARAVSTTVTLVFTVAQALLAAKAGAAFVCPFVGRLDDAGENGIARLGEIVSAFREGGGVATQVLAASIRSPEHVAGAALAGAHAITVPPKLVDTLASHPLTEAGIARFLADAKK